MDSPDRIEGLVATLTTGKKDRAYRHARALLRDEPHEGVVSILIAQMDGDVRKGGSRTFERTANLLAEWGGDAAVEALVRHARTQRRFPRLAINALALCKHPAVVPALLDILAE